MRLNLANANNPGPWDPLFRYQQWSNEAARRLSFSFGEDRVEWLIMSGRFRLLHSIFGTVGDVVNMVQAEFESRQRLLDDLIAEYIGISESSPDDSVVLIAPDANVYLHNRSEFDAINWNGLLEAPKVRIVIPEITVRELDRQKTYGKKVPVYEGAKEQVPARARHSVRKIQELLLTSPDSPSSVRPGLEVEFLANPINHQRLEDPDSEFLDRVLAMQRLLDRRVLVATSDVGMGLMARVNGLEVTSLDLAKVGSGDAAMLPPSGVVTE